VLGARRLLDVICPLWLSVRAVCSLHAVSTLATFGRSLVGFARRRRRRRRRRLGGTLDPCRPVISLVPGRQLRGRRGRPRLGLRLDAVGLRLDAVGLALDRASLGVVRRFALGGWRGSSFGGTHGD
jgi:hypothetical protein